MKLLTQWLTVILQVAFLFVILWVTENVKQQNARLDASRSWPTTEALILDFRLQERPHSNAVNPLVHYRYFVDGQAFEHTRLKFDSTPLKKREAVTLRTLYGEGQIVRVYYNPKTPHIATLTPATNAMVNDGQAVLSILYLVALSVFFCLLVTLQAQRKNSEMAEAEHPKKPQFYLEA